MTARGWSCRTCLETVSLTSWPRCPVWTLGVPSTRRRTPYNLPRPPLPAGGEQGSRRGRPGLSPTHTLPRACTGPTLPVPKTPRVWEELQAAGGHLILHIFLTALPFAQNCATVTAIAVAAKLNIPPVFLTDFRERAGVAWCELRVRLNTDNLASRSSGPTRQARPCPAPETELGGPSPPRPLRGALGPGGPARGG